MRISKPSIHSACIALLMGAASAALAQDSGRQSAANQGQASMDRLESAVARGKDAAGRMPDPTLPRTDDPANIRRAFEGLRNRIPAPDMEARARAAQARGQASLAAERERHAQTLPPALGLETPQAQDLRRQAGRESVRH